MKKNISPVILMLCFGLMLLLPEEVFQGASNGLLLWFHTILPTLFPFLLITGLLMGTGSILVLPPARPPVTKTVLCIASRQFSILAGFLCGYPMGAKSSGRPDRPETDCKERRGLSPVLLQQYKSRFSVSCSSTENTGRFFSIFTSLPWDPSSGSLHHQPVYTKLLFEIRPKIFSIGFPFFSGKTRMVSGTS